ncbi:MAG: pectin acetylesterase-family hydrolase [Thermodesulfobacteriota bacterium]
MLRPDVAARLAGEEGKAQAQIEKRCADLEALVGVDPAEFVARTAAQARCMVATAHGDGGPLALDCGPRAAVPAPARATPVQVVLDEATWGTRCGDGSPYAFWVRLAPEGEPAERVVIYLQGGGVCVFGDDCANVGSALMRALDNTLSGGGILSNTNPDSPFRTWTKVFLPYCTQDLHVGGGTTNVFPEVTVHRFGGLNVRAALRWVRDALWAELDAGSTEGYRPDRLQVLFAGGSAGGFGVNYNYHYLLDELRWSRTAAVPDSGLGLDNGQLFGVAGLGGLMILDEGTVAWRARAMLPPYCHEPRCAVGPEIQVAHSERLEAVPEQVMLNVTNQVDDVQVSTTFFPSRRAWIDALRSAYCATQGMRGLRSFMPAITTSIHGLTANTRFPSTASAGTTLGEWLGSAFAAPGAVDDRVEEGTLAAAFGVQPFACPVAP